MNKPKLTPSKAINKFLILWDIKLNDNKTPVYYAWDIKRKPVWYSDGNGIYPKKKYISVSYDNKKREWYIGYIESIDDRKFCTIDDITGSCSIYEP